MDQQLHSLCTVLGGVTILLKGESDMVCGPRKSTDGQLSLSFDGVSNVYVIETPNHGSPRRCGGQGDILSGCVAVSVLWSSIVNTPTTTVRPLNAMNETAISINEEDVNREDIYVADAPKDSPTLLGCILASTVVKSASHSAFVKKGRSMTSPDVLNEIGTAFERVVGRESY